MSVMRPTPRNKGTTDTTTGMDTGGGAKLRGGGGRGGGEGVEVGSGAQSLSTSTASTTRPSGAHVRNSGAGRHQPHDTMSGLAGFEGASSAPPPPETAFGAGGSTRCVVKRKGSTSPSSWFRNNPYGARRRSSPPHLPQPPAQAQTPQNICRHYLLGKCNRGALCRFTHLEKHHVAVRYSRRAHALRSSWEVPDDVTHEGAESLSEEPVPDVMDAPYDPHASDGSDSKPPLYDAAAAAAAASTLPLLSLDETESVPEDDSTIQNKRRSDEETQSLSASNSNIHRFAAATTKHVAASNDATGCFCCATTNGLTPEISIRSMAGRSNLSDAHCYCPSSAATDVSPHETPQLCWKVTSPFTGPAMESGRVVSHAEHGHDGSVFLLPPPAMPSSAMHQHQPYLAAQCVVGPTRDARTHNPYGAQVMNPDKDDLLRDDDDCTAEETNSRTDRCTEEGNATDACSDVDGGEEGGDRDAYLPVEDNHLVHRHDVAVQPKQALHLPQAPIFHPYPRPATGTASTRTPPLSSGRRSRSGTTSRQPSRTASSTSPETVVVLQRSSQGPAGTFNVQTPTTALPMSATQSPPLNPTAAPFQPTSTSCRNPLDDDADAAFSTMYLPPAGAAATFTRCTSITPQPAARRFQASDAFASASGCQWPQAARVVPTTGFTRHPDDDVMPCASAVATVPVDSELMKELKSLW